MVIEILIEINLFAGLGVRDRHVSLLDVFLDLLLGHLLLELGHAGELRLSLRVLIAGFYGVGNRLIEIEGFAVIEVVVDERAASPLGKLELILHDELPGEFEHVAFKPGIPRGRGVIRERGLEIGQCARLKR